MTLGYRVRIVTTETNGSVIIRAIGSGGQVFVSSPAPAPQREATVKAVRAYCLGAGWDVIDSGADRRRQLRGNYISELIRKAGAE
jgi:hypothetical protein